MLGVPKVVISVQDGGLGQTTSSDDGVAVMVLTGVAVTEGVALNMSNQIFNLDGAIDLGITETGVNAFAYWQIKEFYDTAGSGAELWFMLVDAAVTMEDMADKTKAYASKVLTDAKGDIRLLGLSRLSTGVVTHEDGLDEDVAKAQLKAQELAVDFANKYKDFNVVIDGKDFKGIIADLADYTESDREFVSILMANTNGGKNASIGLLLGRLASDPVQRLPSRVRTGSLPVELAYFTDGTLVEDKEDAWDAIHNKGYIFMVSFVGRAGYFFSAAPTTTLGSSDFNTIPRVRTIYKARRLAYQVLLEELSDEVPLQADGTILPAYVKSFQAAIDTAIATEMTANAEISDARSNIDPSQNVLGTNELKASLEVLPVGYAEYITVDLTFITSLT